MPSDQEQIETIKSLALAQLVELRASPKPSYNLGGQSVSWETYLTSLERTVDWCDAKLTASEPFEISSQGVS
jgi:hypothetical protein